MDCLVILLEDVDYFKSLAVLFFSSHILQQLAADSAPHAHLDTLHFLKQIAHWGSDTSKVAEIWQHFIATLA